MPPRDSGVTVTDRTGKVWTQAQIEAEMLHVEQKLMKFADDIADQTSKASRAEVDWKVALAESRIKSRVRPGSGPGGRTTEDDATDQAIKKHKDLYEDYKIQGAILVGMRDASFTIRSAGEMLQSLNANIRAMVS